MWVYVGDAAHAYNVFDFTLNCGRDGPFRFPLVAQTASVSKPQSAIKNKNPSFSDSLWQTTATSFLDEGPTRKPQADDWQNILI